jgi:hypothetical protein
MGQPHLLIRLFVSLGLLCVTGMTEIQSILPSVTSPG